MFFIGGDASKGYADFCAIDESGKTLYKKKLDDKLSGHQTLIAWLKANCQDCNVYIGLESSGGVELNWLHSLRALIPEMPGLKVCQLNPTRVKKFREINLHEAVTDPSSALAIARYLSVVRPEYFFDPEVEEAKRLEHYIASQVEHCAGLKTQLQGFLVNSHPELVQFARQGFPHWLLTLLKNCPSLGELSEATIQQLTEVPFLSQKRAEQIVRAAQASVASSRGKVTSSLVREVASEILRLEDRIGSLRKELHALFVNDPIVAIWQSVPGIGINTAIYLRLLLGDCRRFKKDSAVVAYCGLDPKIHKSGDESRKLRISRKGDPRARALLFPCAMAAIRGEGRFQTFYQRLLQRGKPKMVALVAVMAKLLRVGYACQIKKVPFDPKLALPLREPRESKEVESKEQSVDAPLSRREAQRRKKKAGATERGQASKSVVSSLTKT